MPLTFALDAFLDVLHEAPDADLDALLEAFEIPPAEDLPHVEWTDAHVNRYPHECSRGHVIEWPGDRDGSGNCLRCRRLRTRKADRLRRGIDVATPCRPPTAPITEWLRVACERKAPKLCDDGTLQTIGCLVPKAGEPRGHGYARHGRAGGHRSVVEYFLRKVDDERLGDDGELPSTWIVHHACYGAEGNKACVELSHLHVWTFARHSTHHRRSRVRAA